MQSNHINKTKANIDKSYIIKSNSGIEKYISKTEDGQFIPSELTKAAIFENRREAEQVANILEQNGHSVEIMEIQNRTRW